MKQLTISRDSWHYKLALYGLLSEDYGETDLCRYWWALVRGVLRAPFLAVLGAAVVFAMVVDPLLVAAVYAATGFVVAPHALILTGALYLLAGFLGAGIYADWRREHRRDQKPGLIRTAYHGWKNKTCVLVRVQ